MHDQCNTKLLFEKRRERISCSCGFAGVPEPLVGWRKGCACSHGGEVFISKKARYWPQRGSCVLQTVGFTGGYSRSPLTFTCTWMLTRGSRAPRAMWWQIFVHKSCDLSDNVSRPFYCIAYRTNHSTLTWQRDLNMSI